MKRREFIQTLGAAALVPRRTFEQAPSAAGATLLYDDRAVSLDRVRTDAANPAKLWVLTRDLPRINEFELKPEGACRADLCIPVPKTMVNGEYFDFSAFARLTGQAE